MESEISSRMAEVSVFYSLTFIIKVKTLVFYNFSEYLANGERYSDIIIRWYVGHLTSNGAIANVLHRNLDLYFQDHKISGNRVIINSWKR